MQYLKKTKKYDFTTEMSTTYNAIKSMKRTTKLSKDRLNTNDKAILALYTHKKG